MKGFCIILRGNEYSESVGTRCIKSAAIFGIPVERWDAVSAEAAAALLQERCLEWRWPDRAEETCPVTGIIKRAYRTRNRWARIGCALSHYELWRKCVKLCEPILILEHDAVFLGQLPVAFRGATMINDPTDATPRGSWWADRIREKGPGIHHKTEVLTDGRADGLAGGSAYIINPDCAEKVSLLAKTVGLWPNDALLCRQLVPDLWESYPFVTEVRAVRTLAGGY